VDVGLHAILGFTAHMGKYKAVKKKTDALPQIKPGVPCLVILFVIAIVVVLVMAWVIRSA
jgi:t-SNARE complex subunit (syntaxin)